MVDLTRRSYLAGTATVAASTVTALGGCLGTVEDAIEDEQSGSEGSLQAMDWLFPPDTDGHGYRYTHWDLGSLTGSDGTERYPERLVREWPTVTRENFDRVLWGDPAEVEEFLLLTKPTYSFAYGGDPGRAIRFNSAQVVRGTDAYVDAADSELSDEYWEHQGTYEGFDIYTEGSEHAVALGEMEGTPLLVRSNFYRIDEQPGVETIERMVDARRGTGPRLRDRDDAAARVQDQLAGDLRVGTAGTSLRFERLARPIDRTGNTPSVGATGLSVTVEDQVECEFVLATAQTVEDPAAMADRIPAIDDWDGTEAEAVDRAVTCRTSVDESALATRPPDRTHPDAEFDVSFEHHGSSLEVVVKHVAGWSVPVEELVVYMERQTESGSWLTRIAPWADHADVETVAVGDRMTAAVPDKLRGGICGVTWGPWSDSSQFSLDHERVDEASIPE